MMTNTYDEPWTFVELKLSINPSVLHTISSHRSCFSWTERRYQPQYNFSCICIKFVSRFLIALTALLTYVTQRQYMVTIVTSWPHRHPADSTCTLLVHLHEHPNRIYCTY